MFFSYICISEDITLHGVYDFGIEFFGVNAKHFTFLFSKGVVIVNSVYRDGRNFLGLLKPVVLFFLVMKIFVRFLPAYQNILPQILKVRGTKTCSYLRTDKQNQKQDQETNYILDLLFLDSFKRTKYKTWNLHNLEVVIKGVPTKFQEIKENYQKSTNQNSTQQILCNIE